MRWSLPDRVFFACGACHILVYAFLERYGKPDMKPLWLKPEPGFRGNHIVVATDTWVFDYHSEMAKGFIRPDWPILGSLRRL